MTTMKTSFKAWHKPQGANKAVEVKPTAEEMAELDAKSGGDVTVSVPLTMVEQLDQVRGQTPRAAAILDAIDFYLDWHKWAAKK